MFALQTPPNPAVCASRVRHRRALCRAARRDGARLLRASGLPSATVDEKPPSLLAKLLGADRAGDAASRILAALLASPTVPIGAYVAEPASFLHALDPRVKQAWLAVLLLLPGALVLPAKAAVAAALALLSVLSLPPRVWAPHLRGLAALSLLIFVFSALGADAVPPLTQPRLPTGVLEALPSVSPSAPYSYRLFTLGPLSATRRGAAFAASAALLAFSALHAAHLALCTTPPEALAHALAWWMAPLRWRHAPAWLATAADELVLTLLLALRFCALAFEAARNLALGAATRGVDWAALGPAGGAATAVLLARRLAAELADTCSRVADAMRARGYAHPSQAKAALVYAAPLRLRWGDGVALLLLAAVLAGAGCGYGCK